ncbi:ribonuclease H-like protein [Ceratobasidium sp. AG-Ba]|nr:ribonuclease H-like protein [Ceratobasidium sp. AG-Ba]
MSARPKPTENDYPKTAFFAVHRGNKACVCSTYGKLMSNIADSKSPIWEAFDNRSHAEHFVKTGRIPSGAAPIKPGAHIVPSNRHRSIHKGISGNSLPNVTKLGSGTRATRSGLAPEVYNIAPRLTLTESTSVPSCSAFCVGRPTTSRVARSVCDAVTVVEPSHEFSPLIETQGPSVLPTNTTASATAAPRVDEKTEVWTGGFCSENHRAPAAYGVYFGDDDPRNEVGRVSGIQTLHRSKLLGVIRALEIVDKTVSNLTVYIDLEYVIKSCTVWLPGWIVRGGQTVEGKPVANYLMIRYLGALVQRWGDKLSLVNVQHKSGHKNTVIANSLAKEAATFITAIPSEVDWTEKRCSLEHRLPRVKNNLPVVKGSTTSVLRVTLTRAVMLDSEDEYKDYDKVELHDIDESQWSSCTRPDTVSHLVADQEKKRRREPISEPENELDYSEVERKAKIREGKKRCVTCPDCDHEFGV